MPHNAPSLQPRLEQSIRARARARQHDNSDAFWDKHCSEFYMPDAEYRCAFVGVRFPFSGSFLDKPLAMSAHSLAKLLQYKYDSGVLDEFLILGPTYHEVSLGNVKVYEKSGVGGD